MTYHRFAPFVLAGLGFALPQPSAAQTLQATAVDALASYGPTVFDRVRQRAVMVRTIRFSPSRQHDLVAWDGGDWVPILPPIVIPQSVDHLAYDAVRDRLLVLGGREMRTVRGTEIGLLPSVPSPAGFFQVPEQRRVAHDSARDEIVVFGGSHVQPGPVPTSVLYDQTYVFRQGAWQEIQLAVRPPARDGHALVYDPVRQRTVLCGGRGGALTYLDDTWEWDGATWTQIAIAGPTGASRGIYDAATQRVVVMDTFGNVWAFDGSAWTSVGSGMPRRSAWLAFDGTSLLLAGRAQQYLYDLETWRWTGGAWQLVPSSVHMHSDYSALMAYDTLRRELLCVHVNPPTSWIPTSTWTWNGRWRKHSGTTPGFGGLAFDSARGEGVLFGGWSGGETWTWDGSAWTQRAPAVAPAPHQNPQLAYDPVRALTVLFGSAGTWTWDGTSWTQGVGPQPPLGHAPIFVYDPSRAAIVMTGGSTFAGQTWEWAGQWIQRSSSSGLANAAVAAFDPLRGRLFAYENTLEHEWTGSAWIARPSPLPLRLQYARAMATDPDRRRILFRGVVGAAEAIHLHVLGETPSLVEDLGGGCASSLPLTVEERPAVGVTMELATSTAPGSVVLFGFSLQAISIPIGACTLLVDGTLSVLPRLAGSSGRADLPVSIAYDLSWRGVAVFVQAGVVLPSGQLELSRALRLLVGD
jgi:hypothetical protein